MDNQEFLKNFEAQFDEVESNTLSMDTEFKNIEEWSSLNALLLIAMADSEYGITLTGGDIRNSKTVQDLYNIILNKKD